MLGAAILNAIPLVMIYLARVLRPRVNRWANIVAAALTIVYVIGGDPLIARLVFFVLFALL